MPQQYKPATLYDPKDPKNTRTEARTKEEADRLFSSGYQLEKVSPETTTPGPAEVRRTGDGGIESLITSKNLESWKSQSKFYDYIKEGIKMKQGMNKDIRGAKTYWRTMGKDTSPFSDEAFRLLSPGQQSSLRAKKYATATAHLTGLEEEEAYRETRMSDTLGKLRGVIEEETDRPGKELDNLIKRLKTQKDLDELGYTYEDGELVKDYSSTDAKSIAEAIKKTEGGVSYDYSDPNRAEKGAYQFMPATWSAWSSAYAADVLRQSTAELEMTEENQDAVAEWKIQGWLDAGYSPQEIAATWNSGRKEYKGRRGTSTITGEPYDVEAYVGRFSKALGETLPEDVEPITLSESVKGTLMKKFGLTNPDVVGWSNDDWFVFGTIAKETAIEEAEAYLDKEVAKGKAKGDKKEQLIIKGVLQKDYGSILSAGDINGLLYRYGLTEAGALEYIPEKPRT